MFFIGNNIIGIKEIMNVYKMPFTQYMKALGKGSCCSNSSEREPWT